jgi:DNA-binding transcriptional ArsR family regulator
MALNISLAAHQHFVYHQTMNVNGTSRQTTDTDATAASIAAAIGELARARMLYCLIDGRARTSTELAAVADVTPSTASVHLQRLKSCRLVQVYAQGKHRYYSLGGTRVAAALEALSVLAGGSRNTFIPNTPEYLRAARTCYDHIAGSLGVALHDRFKSLGWLSHAARASAASPSPARNGASSYDVTHAGAKALSALGIDLDAHRVLRRRFAFACLDWSERRPHLGGALGAALLAVALKRKWVAKELDSRALHVTGFGRRELRARFGLSDF